MTSPQGRRHLLLLSIDDCRFDALGFERDKAYLRPYSLDQAPSTPNIDRLAREGATFGQCRTTAPFTPPSHGSMLTGQYPFRHGVRPFLKQQLNEASKTLFERLGSAGFVSLATIDFQDTFTLTAISRGATMLPRRQDEAAIAEFGKHAKAGKRVFLFMHIVDVHPPYGETFSPESPADNEPFIEDYLALAAKLGLAVSPDEAKKARTDRAALLALSNQVRQHAEKAGLTAGANFPRYLAGINRFDSLRFKRIFDRLEKLGVLDDTLVVITADHGQAMLSPEFLAEESDGHAHRKFDHGECIAEELLRVPLIFWSRAADFRPGSWDAPVSLVDIAPTVLGALEVPFGAAEMDGVNRRALLFERYGTGTEWKRAQAPSDCYAEAWYHDRAVLSAYLKKCAAAGAMVEPGYDTYLHQQTVRAGEYKLVLDVGRGNKAALYNTVRDPWERMNLLDYFPFYEKWNFIPNYDRVARPLVRRLKSLTEGAPATAGISISAATASKTVDVSSLEERLRELGYID